MRRNSESGEVFGEDCATEKRRNVEVIVRSLLRVINRERKGKRAEIRRSPKTFKGAQSQNRSKMMLTNDSEFGYTADVTESVRLSRGVVQLRIEESTEYRTLTQKTDVVA